MAKTSVIPFGPQHPVLLEPLHLDLIVKDEKVIEAVPQINFNHRGLEKLVEQKDYNQFVYVAERICGICSFGNSMGYSEAVEQLFKIEIPIRAQFLRVIWHELSRISSHLLWMSFVANAFGFESLSMYCWRLRERILTLFENTTGSRVIFSVCKIGGVSKNMDKSQLQEFKHVLNGLKDEYAQLCKTFLNDKSVQSRTVDVAYLSYEEAKKYCLVGPFARASYLNNDVRCLGLGAYGKLDNFKPVLDSGGDCYARIKVRALEVLQSTEIIEELIEKIPEGDISINVKGSIKADAQASAIIEQPRGEAFYYVAGNRSKFLDRMHVRTPTAQNIGGMVTCLAGCDLADVNMIILTIDPCISCTER